MATLLDVRGLKTSFFTHLGEVQAVRGVDFEVRNGGSLGIVGESGSGKSVTALSVMRLLQYPGKIKSGEILFKGEDLVKFDKKKIRKVRGSQIAMIFQDPMTSLSPVYMVGNQIVEMILEHYDISRQKAKERAISMLKLVGIPSAEERFKQYPHEFSGGMRQRAMIAMAISCDPSLLIADEPTTALDVTIQAQIIDLMKSLRNKINTSIVMITHDLGVVANLCEDIIVMYGGLIMERGTTRDIFYQPKHPYTIGLLNSIPSINARNEKLTPIQGSPPDLIHPPKGCPFCYRCEYAFEICAREMPKVYGEGFHRVACWLSDPDAPKVAKYENAKGGVRR